MKSDLWENITHTTICIIGVPEEEEREKGPKKISEEVIAKLPQYGKGNSQPSPEVQRAPVRINPRRNTLRHIVIKLIKTKDKFLKATREKRQHTRENP